ncbi:MBL fold metallo-hydrolase [Corynebacterium auriscanis]|uniref:MBL fold metallo-hydrolase n=1 Tax=Corynebacterium auriscanis TaxID=99807 RepID=UPI003CEE3972
MTKPTLNHVTHFGALTEPRDTEVVEGTDFTVVHTTVGSMDNNCWFIARDGQALLIDAADDAAHLLAIADELGVEIKDVLTTHQHADHTRALTEVLAATGARHHAPRKDAEAIPAPADETYGTDDGVAENLRLASGALNSLELQVVELRGHTPGGLAVLGSLPDAASSSPCAWVGDSVFPGGVGKTSNEEDFQQLLDDVNSRIFSLSANTIIYPGHGDSTTVGEEKPKADEWRARGW